MGVKEKLLGFGSSASGGLSILGGYNVCHNVCLGAIAVLSALGIAVAGMPLMFLQKIALPFWIAAAALLLAMLALSKISTLRFSPKILLANTGFIIAGTPFRSLDAFQPLFWALGGTLVAGSIAWAVRGRKKRSTARRKRCC